MQDRLYYLEPNLREWETEVKEIKEEGGKVLVTLKESCFYPEGGGQPSDRGYINDIEVLDVLEENDEVYHVVKKAPVNNKVKCRLDFERRLDLMQQHSGQHLLSAVFYNLYKGETSSFHLGDDYVSIDISLQEVSDHMVKEVEDKVNQYIYDNLPIKTYFVDKDELQKLPLRKFPKVEKNIRIVEIENIDFSPCCGTHTESTGEIGIIKILKTEKYKGATRIYFKCGKRALLEYQNVQNIIIELSRYFSIDTKAMLDRVKLESLELKDKSKEIKELKEKLCMFEVEKIIKANDTKIIAKYFDEKGFDEVQLIAKKILEKGEYLLILASGTDRKLILCHNGTFKVSCGKIFKENLATFNGKGGGNDKQAQGGFTEEKDLKDFLEFVKLKIVL